MLNEGGEIFNVFKNKVDKKNKIKKKTFKICMRSPIPSKPSCLIMFG